MNRFVPLMQREWLQYRFGWTLMVLVPLALAVILTSFGQVQFGPGEGPPPALLGAPLMTFTSVVGATAILGVIAWIQSLILVSGLARRDHGDRSVEFWLSLPVSHSASLGVPLLVHLVLVPAGALVVGLGVGLLMSVLVVGRVAGLGEWLSQPWGEVLSACTLLTARVVAGVPLMTLWLSPLILLAVLMVAWLRRWGLVVLAVLLAVGSTQVGQLFGEPLIQQVLRDLFRHAGQALVGASGHGLVVRTPQELPALLASVPAWVAADLAAALRDLFSPLFAGAVAFAAACFAGLVDWRRRGASVAAG